MKRKALETQLKYQKHILRLQEVLPAGKKGLLQVSNNTIKEMEANLKEILTISPNDKELSDFDADEIRITGKSVLSAEEREQLFKERISVLEKRLIAQREKIMQAQAGSESEGVMQIGKEKVGAKRKVAESSASNKKICKAKIPDPVFLVGKRVEHSFPLQKPGRKRRSRTIFTGTVLDIAKESNDPLYTRY